jgi:DNA-binding XRE family transcriptional regulator
MEKNNNPALGDWDELMERLTTPEERAQIAMRTALIGELVKARDERGLSQQKLGELSGVKQPVISRMERGTTSPTLETVIKLLAPLGKTLYIGDLQRGTQPRA